MPIESDNLLLDPAALPFEGAAMQCRLACKLNESPAQPWSSHMSRFWQLTLDRGRSGGGMCLCRQ